jgi:hypothetical protein
MNIRQNNNNNRRRGRGNNSNNNNNRGSNRSGGVDHQNSIDNRARGNASQMLDKYKKLAQDAQLNDDRVNAEYYLQFADHYFRVLADYRARNESKQEERRPRDDDRGFDRYQGENDQENERGAEGETDFSETADTEEQPRRQEREPREREPRERDTKERAPKERGSRDRKPRRPREDEQSADRFEERDSIDLAVLPPSISISDSADADEGEKPARKPRARRAKPAKDDSEAVATAAE